MSPESVIGAHASPAALQWVVAIFCALTTAGLVINAALLRRWRRDPPDGRELAAGFAARAWPVRDAVALVGSIFLLYLATGMAHAILVRGLGADALPGHAAQLALMSILLYGTVLLFAVRWLRQQAWMPLHNTLASAWQRVVLGLTFYLAAWPFFWLLSLLWRGMLYWHGVELTNQPVLWDISGPHTPLLKAYLLFVAVALAPLAEEFLFRRVLLPLAARKLGLGPAVIVVSLLFAAAHGHLPSFGPLFVVGVALALAYVYTGSLLVPVTMHAVFNAVNLTLFALLKGP